MKKIILTLSIVLAGIIGANAQAKDHTTETVEGYKKMCGLTDEQAAKVKPMAENYMKAEEARKAKYAQDKDNKESVKAKAANKEDLDNQVKAILTPEQKTKLEAYRAKEKQEAEKAKATEGKK